MEDVTQTVNRAIFQVENMYEKSIWIHRNVRIMLCGMGSSRAVRARLLAAGRTCELWALTCSHGADAPFPGERCSRAGNWVNLKLWGCFSVADVKILLGWCLCFGAF